MQEAKGRYYEHSKGGNSLHLLIRDIMHTQSHTSLVSWNSYIDRLTSAFLDTAVEVITKKGEKPDLQRKYKDCNVAKKWEFSDMKSCYFNEEKVPFLPSPKK